jgi:hypothetical protein
MEVVRFLTLSDMWPFRKGARHLLTQLGMLAGRLHDFGSIGMLGEHVFYHALEGQKGITSGPGISIWA